MSEESKVTDPLVITGLGLMTAVGHQAAQALTSMRAGITRLVEVPSYEPIVRDAAMHFPEPLVAAPVTGVTDGLVEIERLFALGIPALQEALKDAGLDDADLEDTALFVAGGDRPSAALGSRIATVFLPRLAQRVTNRTFKQSKYYPTGSAGCLGALRDGMELLQQQACRYCIIGGVDSWLDEETLVWLDEHRRLKSESNPDSFIAGEAAAFVVIETMAHASQRDKRPYAQCCEVAVAQEEHTIWTDTPCTAQALSDCLHESVATLASMDKMPDAVLCNLNGEYYRSVEWGYASTRVFKNGRPVPPLVHPADCIGDTGAASGGILVSLAAFGISQEVVTWNSAVVWCSSDNGQRAAVGIFGQ